MNDAFGWENGGKMPEGNQKGKKLKLAALSDIDKPTRDSTGAIPIEIHLQPDVF